MKKSELAFSFLLVPIDILMIIASFALSYKLQAQRVEFTYLWPFADYMRFIIYLVPVWLVIFTLEGLYNTQKRRQGLDEFSGILLGVSSSIMVVMAWLFLSKTIFFSRAIIIYTWIFAIIFVTVSRWLVRVLQRYLYRYGIGVHRLIVIGDNGLAQDVLKEIQKNKGLGYKFMGLVKSSTVGKGKENTKILGDVNSFEDIIAQNKTDDVILTDANVSDKQISKIITCCHDHKIIFKQIPNFFQVQTTNVGFSALAGMPIVEFKITPLEGWGRISKRVIDIIGSLIGIIIFGIPMLIVALIIKLDSSGPVIYKNERVGEGGKKFNVYKFRSMKIEYCTGNQYGGKDAEEYEKKLIKEKNERSGPVYKVLKDPRRTKFGRFIERTSLDELPQFFNSLIGDMSLAGPRPHQPREVAGYQQWQKKVLRIKPGITGMAQISGRSDLDFDDEARLDIYYIENWSLWLDTKILLKTPLTLIRSRKTA